MYWRKEERTDLADKIGGRMRPVCISDWATGRYVKELSYTVALSELPVKQ